MVGGNHINCAVDDSLNQRISVGLRSYRRIHFKSSVVLQHTVVKNEVVGSRFAGDVNAVCLCLSYKLNAFLGRNVANVIFTSRFFHKLDVALYLTPFALAANSFVSIFCRVFAIMNVSAF